jgi:hypothetical protein
MTGRVVDDLELIQVEIAEDMMAPIFLRTGERPVEALFELAPVNQTSQGIVCRFMRYPFDQLARLGHVAEYHDRAGRVSLVIPDRRRGALDGELLAVTTP